MDPRKAGLGPTAFVAGTAQDHSPASQVALGSTPAGLPEVLEVWRLAGEADYLIRVVTPDMAAIDRLYRHLTACLTLKAVTSQLALERVACSTALASSPSAVKRPPWRSAAYPTRP